MVRVLQKEMGKYPKESLVSPTTCSTLNKSTNSTDTPTNFLVGTIAPTVSGYRTVFGTEIDEAILAKFIFDLPTVNKDEPSTTVSNPFNDMKVGLTVPKLLSDLEDQVYHDFLNVLNRKPNDLKTAAPKPWILRFLMDKLLHQSLLLEETVDQNLNSTDINWELVTKYHRVFIALLFKRLLASPTLFKIGKLQTENYIRSYEIDNSEVKIQAFKRKIGYQPSNKLNEFKLTEETLILNQLPHRHRTDFYFLFYQEYGALVQFSLNNKLKLPSLSLSSTQYESLNKAHQQKLLVPNLTLTKDLLFKLIIRPFQFNLIEFPAAVTATIFQYLDSYDLEVISYVSRKWRWATFPSLIKELHISVTNLQDRVKYDQLVNLLKKYPTCVTSLVLSHLDPYHLGLEKVRSLIAVMLEINDHVPITQLKLVGGGWFDKLNSIISSSTSVYHHLLKILDSNLVGLDLTKCSVPTAATIDLSFPTSTTKLEGIHLPPLKAFTNLLQQLDLSLVTSLSCAFDSALLKPANKPLPTKLKVLNLWVDKQTFLPPTTFQASLLGFLFKFNELHTLSVRGLDLQTAAALAQLLPPDHPRRFYFKSLEIEVTQVEGTDRKLTEFEKEEMLDGLMYYCLSCLAPPPTSLTLSSFRLALPPRFNLKLMPQLFTKTKFRSLRMISAGQSLTLLLEVLHKDLVELEFWLKDFNCIDDPELCLISIRTQQKLNLLPINTNVHPNRWQLNRLSIKCHFLNFSTGFQLLQQLPNLQSFRLHLTDTNEVCFLNNNEPKEYSFLDGIEHLDRNWKADKVLETVFTFLGRFTNLKFETPPSLRYLQVLWSHQTPSFLSTRIVNTLIDPYTSSHFNLPNPTLLALEIWGFKLLSHFPNLKLGDVQLNGLQVGPIAERIFKRKQGHLKAFPNFKFLEAKAYLEDDHVSEKFWTGG